MNTLVVSVVGAVVVVVVVVVLAAAVVVVVVGNHKNIRNEIQQKQIQSDPMVE